MCFPHALFFVIVCFHKVFKLAKGTDPRLIRDNHYSPPKTTCSAGCSKSTGEGDLPIGHNEAQCILGTRTCHRAFCLPMSPQAAKDLRYKLGKMGGQLGESGVWFGLLSFPCWFRRGKILGYLPRPFFPGILLSKSHREKMAEKNGGINP